MAVFGGMTLTNKGLALQGKAQAGAELKYTRVAVGDGSLSGQSIPALTALISHKKNLNISGIKTQSPNKAAISAVLTNSDVAIGFWMREIGLFAQDPDIGEILYAYANAGATADYIAPTGGTDVVEKEIDVIVAVGTASNITAMIDTSLVFATLNDLNEVSADLSGHEGNEDIHITSTERKAWNDKLDASSYTAADVLAKLKTVDGAGSGLDADTVDNKQLTDIIRGDMVFATTAGTATAYTATFNPAVTLVAGLTIRLKAHVDSGANPTLNADGTGAKAIRKPNGSAGKLVLGGVYTLTYDGSAFILQGEGGGVIPKLPNMVKNGSFEGDTFWAPSGASAYNLTTTYHKYGTRSGEIVGSSAECFLISDGMPYTQGHRYYVRCWVNSSVAGKTADMFWPLVGSFPYFSISCPVANTWYPISFISADPAITSGNYQLRLDNNSAGSSTTMRFDGVMLIDLTEAFGVGNEPTVGEMDAAVEALGGWWDTDLSTLTSDATVTAGDVLAGKYFYHNGTRDQGTMVRRTGGEFSGYERAAIVASFDGRAHFYVPPGAYIDKTADQGGQNVGIFADDPDFIAANFLANKNIFGLQGSIPIRVNNEAPNGTGYWQPGINGHANPMMHMLPQAGYYDGANVWVSKEVPGLVASNIRQGVSFPELGGLTGTLVEGKRYAEVLVGTLAGGQYSNIDVGFSPVVATMTGRVYATNDTRCVASMVSGNWVHGRDDLIQGLWLQQFSGNIVVIHCPFSSGYVYDVVLRVWG